MILAAIAAKLKQRAKADFRARHFEAALIVQAVSWYLHYPLSYRDIEEMLLERGLQVNHSTLNRWVLAYASLVEKRLRQFRRPHCGSVQTDETYVKVRGRWRYLYRAVDKHGQAVDFLLTAQRDLDAAKQFFRKMLQDQSLLAPDRIGTDGAGSYPSAIAERRAGGLLPRTPVQYVTKRLQQRIENDHFRIKRARPRVGGFRSFHTARRTICGFEAMLWLRKGFGFAGALLWTSRQEQSMKVERKTPFFGPQPSLRHALSDPHAAAAQPSLVWRSGQGSNGYNPWRPGSDSRASQTSAWLRCPRSASRPPGGPCRGQPPWRVPGLAPAGGADRHNPYGQPPRGRRAACR